ncbi:acetoin utilization protein acuB [Flavobacterium sp.]|jgi:predicted transcriptional regulator|uniref:acetoin utilization protein acuB n=1 Tax=Flavobacterium sp. TaxID=239 RepID=UPI0037BFFF6A
MEITDYINNDYKPLPIQENISNVQDFFSDVAFSHFPVVDERVYLGSINADDAETYDSEKKINDYRFNLDGFYARTTMVWLDVLEIFAQNQTNIVPVLTPENRYVGYYEIQDVVRFFYDTPFLREQGGIVIVEKELLDYSMSQIAQIVESNGGRILGSFLSNSTSNLVQITLKIASGSVNEIIQTFRRYGYVIISENQEDTYLESLKERSDYLDKYLNI